MFIEMKKITMKTLLFFKLIFGSTEPMETILGGRTSATKKLEQLAAGKPPIITVDHSFDKIMDDGTISPVQDAWIETVDNGITIHWEDGTEDHYSDEFSGSSGIRQAHSQFVRDDIKDEYEQWATNGFVDKVRNTFDNCRCAQMFALPLSSIQEWEKWYHLCNRPDPARWAIYEDCEIVEKMQKCIRYDARGKRMIRTEEDLTEKKTDGFAMVILEDKDLTQEQINQIINEAEGGSLRYPLTKVSFCFVLASTVRKMFDKYKKVEFREDIYGQVFGRDNLPSIIMFKSGFKGSKVIKTKADFDIFRSNGEAYGHRFELCIINHVSSKDMPYMALQSFLTTKAQAKILSDEAWKKLLPYTAEKAAFLVGGNLGKAAQIFQELQGCSLFQAEWELAAKSWFHRIIGGKFPKCVKYHIVGCDTAAVLQWLMGYNHPHGLIPAGCVICNRYKPGTTLGSYRMPNNDNNISLLRVMACPEEWRGMYLGSTIFVSMHGTEMTLKQMDFDGDKMGVFKMSILIKMAEEAITKQDRLPLVLRDLPKPAPRPGSVEDWREFDKYILAAPVGMYARTCMMLWGSRGYAKGFDGIYRGSEGSTLIIDMAKNPLEVLGADGNPIHPMDIQQLMGMIDPEFAFNCFNKDGAYRGMKPGRFYAYSKSSFVKQDALHERIAGTKFCPTSGLEWYSGYMRIKEPFFKLKAPKWTDKHVTNAVAHMLCKGEGKFVSQLVPAFNNMIAEAKESLLSMRANPYDASAETLEYIHDYVLDKLNEFAAFNSIDFDTVVDGLAMACYARSNEIKYNNTKRDCWNIVGDIWVNNLKANIEAGRWNELSGKCDQNDPIFDYCEEISFTPVDEDFDASVLDDDCIWCYNDEEEGGDD